MARHKNGNWSLPDPVVTCEQAGVSVLMDIRDEMKRLNELLHCRNFIGIPFDLHRIALNTTKKRKRRTSGNKKKNA